MLESLATTSKIGRLTDTRLMKKLYEAVYLSLKWLNFFI